MVVRPWCDDWQVGKRPSFLDEATSRLSFLVEDRGFVGPETERPPQPFPAVTWLRYHRSDMTIEVVHVVAYMGEDYVETRCRLKGDEDGGWIELGHNTTHTGYQLPACP
jgi:hypothetical protein